MNHERPVSLYIVTRGADKERLRPLVRLLLTMAMRQLMGAELRYEDGQAIMPHRHRLLALLDEFPSLLRMEVIEGSLRSPPATGSSFFLAPRTVSSFSKPTASTRASRATATSASSTRRTKAAPRTGSATTSVTHYRQGGRDRKRPQERVAQERVADLSRGFPSGDDAR